MPEEGSAFRGEGGNTLKAKALKKGDRIGLVAPASGLYNRSYVDRTVEALKEWGYEAVLGENVKGKYGFFSAPDDARAREFNQMFARDDIDGIFVTCGGYGSARILDKIDYEIIAEHPKIFLGFSDITTLHLAIYKKTGLVTFHGPGSASFPAETLTDYTREYLEKALVRKDPIGVIPLSDPKKYVYAIGSGSSQGILIGGNISIICSTLGTPYEIDTKDKILLMEDLDTEPWVMDHMMAHLRNAGKFDQLAGVVIGECYNCTPREHQPNYYCDTSIEDIFEEYLQPYGIPVLYGLPLGHTEDIATLPHGVMARVDADKKEFSILESGTI